MKIKTEFLLPIVAFWPICSHAFDWIFQPDFRFTERYTDNLRMQVNPQRDNLISTLSPGLTLGYLTENQELRSSFRWNELIYHGESELDFSEKIANLNHRYTAERYKADLALQYAEQSSINTQLDLDGSGNLQVQVPRTTRSIAPSITYNVTERNALQLGFNYSDVAFDTQPSIAGNLGFSDYDNQQFNAGWIHTLTENLSLNATAAYSKFSSSNSFNSLDIVTQINGNPVPPVLIAPGTNSFNQTSDTFLYQAGAQYALDEKTQLSASAGIRNTSITSQIDFDFLNPAFGDKRLTPPTSNNSGHVFSVNLDRRFERGNISLNAGQQLNPASSGFQQTTTNFSSIARYNIDERWSTGITASYLQSDQISTINNFAQAFNRTLYSVSPNIRWRWTPEINLDLSYTYQQQDFESIGRSALSNSILFQFSYQPQTNRQVK